MIIAIDGPSASGKGTLARKLAAHYHLPHLDTGALYRAVALCLVRAGFTADATAEAIAIAAQLKTTLLAPEARILLDDPELRSEPVTQATSRLAAIPAVRQELLALQQAFANQPGGAVLDGRDIGTVIAVHADIKLFVQAAPEKRALRRWKELHLIDKTVTYEAVLHAMQARDAYDATRAIAPAHPAPDAVVLDTSALTADAAFMAALAIVNAKMPATMPNTNGLKY